MLSKCAKERKRNSTKKQGENFKELFFTLGRRLDGGEMGKSVFWIAFLAFVNCSIMNSSMC